jgi:hypothetical protein
LRWKQNIIIHYKRPNDTLLTQFVAIHHPNSQFLDLRNGHPKCSGCTSIYPAGLTKLITHGEGFNKRRM